MPFSIGKFILDIRKQLVKHKKVIVAVAEGIKDKDGIYISSQANKKDSFGHSMLSGVGKYLEDIVTRNIGCKFRSIEFSLLQRCAAHIASETDQAESEELG